MMRKKPDTKIMAVANGVNNSERAQLKHIQQYMAKHDTSIDIPHGPQGDLYFRHKGKWIHKGKFCYVCDKPLGHNQLIIDKHRYVCKGLNNRLGD